MKKKIGIIGNGNVGSALLRGAEQAGYEAKAVGKDPKGVRDTAEFADLVIFAVPFGAIDDTLRKVGDAIKGKIVIDVTNALTEDFQLAVGFTTSGAEELQKKAPTAKVVKAFNTVFAQHMDSGKLKSNTLTAFAASDDAEAKAEVLELARAIGFDAIDAGPLKNARLLENLGFMNITLGYMLKMGLDTGFKYLH
jgi:predicted dinucleotide-binding enzyme